MYIRVSARDEQKTGSITMKSESLGLFYIGTKAHIGCTAGSLDRGTWSSIRSGVGKEQGQSELSPK